MSSITGAIHHFDLESAFSKRALMIFDSVVANGAGSDFGSFIRHFEESEKWWELHDRPYEALYASNALRLIPHSEEEDAVEYWQRSQFSDESRKLRWVDQKSRQLAVAIEPSENERIVPLLHSDNFQPHSAGKRTAVLHLILNRLPLPDSDTPWEAIIDWRNDKEARRKYRRLRAWLSRVCREGLNVPDVEDELATLLDDYERYMSIQHKKMKHTVVETFAITTAEIIEDIATLKLSSAVQKLFNLYHEDVALLEAELDAPGREVAYITATQEQF